GPPGGREPVSGGHHETHRRQAPQRADRQRQPPLPQPPLALRRPPGDRRGDRVTHSGFTGFPSRPQSTPIPNVFFSDILPQLTDAASIAVTLFAFNMLSKKKGFPRYLTREDFDAEPALQTFLANAGATDQPRPIDAALAHATTL